MVIVFPPPTMMRSTFAIGFAVMFSVSFVMVAGYCTVTEAMLFCRS